MFFPVLYAPTQFLTYFSFSGGVTLRVALSAGWDGLAPSKSQGMGASLRVNGPHASSILSVPSLVSLN